ARPRKLDEARGNIALLRARLAAALAGIFELRMAACETEHTLIDQRVIDDDIGLGERVQRMESEQARIARPGADKPDPARFKSGQTRACRELRVERRSATKADDLAVTHITNFCWYLISSPTLARK